MARKKIDISELTVSPFTKWRDDWALVTASDGEKVNTMTIQWGGLGVLWQKNVVTVYVHPDRYTHEFMDKADKFTVTFFDDQRDALKFLGTVSGRDRDKIQESGLTVEWVDDAPAFQEAALTITCRILYRDDLLRENFISEEIGDKTWGHPMIKDKPLHTFYIGEVIGIYGEE